MLAAAGVYKNTRIYGTLSRRKISKLTLIIVFFFLKKTELIHNLEKDKETSLIISQPRRDSDLTTITT